MGGGRERGGGEALEKLSVRRKRKSVRRRMRKPKILQSLYKIVGYRNNQRNFDNYYEFKKSIEIGFLIFFFEYNQLKVPKSQIPLTNFK